MDSPTTEDGNPFGDIPTRPMRVKVLYTFDYENKTNCLARFSDTLQIPAVAIDDNAQVGVIELRQCIQAIVAASPELLSRLAEGDFTIYAYDYSEYETPLVGQGMLSSALAASAPLVPAHQSKTMITGRVCKNLPALFSNGVKETLEVKLRLVPVPKQVQNEYVKSMESLRSQSPAMSAGFDPNAWNASLNPGNSQQSNNDYFNFDMGTPGSQQEQSMIDEMFGLGSGSGADGSGHQALGGVGMAQTPSGNLTGSNPAFASHPHSAPGSRAGSPMMGPESSALNQQLRHNSFSAASTNFADQSRPGSRASVRSESYAPSPTHHRQPSTQSADFTQHVENFYNEDGQPRKRAKVTQTDWRGKSSFGGRSSDLRVTAATAASMQMHRPVPTRPSAPGSNLEPPPRVPTPTPQLGLPAQQRPRIPSARSMLRQASTTGSDFMSDIDQMSEAVASSPEDASPENSVIAGETPQEFPSSPPLFPGVNLPAPSSPGLPTLPAPRMADSGYMSERPFTSGNFMDNFDGDTEDRSPDAEDYRTAAQYQPRKQQQRKSRIKSEGLDVAKMPPPYPSDAPTSELNFEWEQPGDMNQLPQKMLLNLPPGRGGERPSSAKRASRANSPAPRSMTPNLAANESTAGNPQSRAPSLAPAATLTQRATPVGSAPPESRRGSLALALPTKRPAPNDDAASETSNPPAKKRQVSRRARSAYADSDAGSPAPSDTEGRPSGPNRSGSGAQRRKIIEQRMHDAVAKGEMPQYCVHCGAIETPTWRKLYFKVMEGKPGPLDSVEDEGETIGVAPLEWDDAGEVCKFIIRKSMKKAAKDSAGPGFEEVVICNPCGLWFKKNRNMRPKDRWGKKSGPRKSRKNRMGEVGIATDSVEPESEAFFTDAVMPEDVPEEATTPRASSGDQTQRAALGRPRAQSMQMQQRPEAPSQWDASQLDAALQRAIQSSPGRFHGSQDSPIEIEELTPKPTRRMLFPSPRQEGQVKGLDDNGKKSKSPTEGEKEGHHDKASMATAGQNDVSIFDAFTFDKENMPPPFDDDDELAHLFDGSPSALFRTPGKTPRKTPPKASQASIDQLLKTPTPASRKRKLLTPSAAAANNANQPSLSNDFMTSPGSSRYFLRSTPTRLANTPGRRSGIGSDNSQQASPFSRHLSQLLNTATGGDGDCFTSPSAGIDFSDLPTFTTPGRWEGIMSSDFGVFEDGQV